MPESIKGRNSSIDFIKFLFAIIILVFHFGRIEGNEFIPGGYIVVEGYFMISGYFMMNSVRKSKECNIGKDTLNFIGRKLSSFFLPLLFSNLLAYLVLAFREGYSIGTALAKSVYLLSDIFPLQITGIENLCPTGATWYISAMMIALLILYPIARKTGSSFTRVICPLIVFLLYGALCREYIAISVIMNEFVGTPLAAGLLRGIAGIAAGCMLFECVQATKDYKVTLFGQVCFLGAELLSVAFIFVYMVRFSRTQMDYFTLPFFFILLYSYFGRKSLFSRKFSFKASKHLSTVSFLLYLNHNYWNYLIAERYPDMAYTDKIVFSLIGTAAASIVVQAATLLTKLLWKKLKPFLKKHFVGELCE